MAIVLSNQDNIELLLTLVKVAIALGLIAITMGLLFWLRLKKLEKRIYLSRKHLNKRLASRNYPKMSKKILAATASHRYNVNTNHIPPQKTQFYHPKTFTKPTKISSRHSGKSGWRWLMAIAIASVTGIAIALLQFSNGSINFDLMPLIWLLIGLVLVIAGTWE